MNDTTKPPHPSDYKANVTPNVHMSDEEKTPAGVPSIPARLKGYNPPRPYEYTSDPRYNPATFPLSGPVPDWIRPNEIIPIPAWSPWPALVPAANPKTLMGALKVPNLSVIPFTAIIEEGRAMEYGAYHAPRKDGAFGYGPFNWRDNNIEYMTYIEAAIRHLASAADRENIDPETGEHMVTHLGLARATIGILIDAIAHETVLDNRPKTARGVVAALLRKFKKQVEK